MGAGQREALLANAEYRRLASKRTLLIGKKNAPDRVALSRRIGPPEVVAGRGGGRR